MGFILFGSLLRSESIRIGRSRPKRSKHSLTEGFVREQRPDADALMVYRCRLTASGLQRTWAKTDHRFLYSLPNVYRLNELSGKATRQRVRPGPKWICRGTTRESSQDVASATLSEPTVYVRSEKAHLFHRQGRPLVFAGAIVEPPKSQSRDRRALWPRSGDLVRVMVDATTTCRKGSVSSMPDDTVLGYGFYNHDSMYRVRLIWQTRLDGEAIPRQEQADGTFRIDLKRVLARHFATALGIREHLGLLEGPAPACRLINGEGDRVSGLCVDLYAQYLVVQSSARWAEQYRAQIEAALLDVTSGKYSVIWRPNWDRLRQDGISKESVSSRPDPLMGQTPQGEEPAQIPPITIMENGLFFLADLEHGQKTGHYCDQRDNRLFVRQLVQDAHIERVLDLCTYTGGFAMNAIRGGAHQVTAVDSSSQALRLAYKNATTNQISCTLVLDEHASMPEPPTTTLWLQRDDVQNFCDRLYAAAAAGSGNELLYDLVVLDPPKLAPTVESLPRARHRYRKMNAAAMKAVRKGGFLFTCTCSASMTQNGMFPATLMEAAFDAGRKITILAERGAALDHVVSPAAPEGRYLTALLLAVE
ncbi:hypothetical protein F1559_003214 [Cyanidiococcus yangmingshanensis]|uniref:S-adenosylmethionine-dependent methyltransferase domain-containing protein n=1 Tax=Cyanidiococcus yangmingshanensis TaxID=2690220 RepID=A0A7J7IIV9_9RHOD|nr:hypothetical protein F1559_003214 [Cyanidiococcus yangmingshanensis]